MNDPRKAAENFSVIIEGIKRPRSTSCFRRIFKELSRIPDFILLLEHCLRRHEAQFSEGEHLDLVRKVTEFLCAWLLIKKGSMEDFFRGDILEGTIVHLSQYDYCRRDPAASKNLSTLFGYYINPREHYDILGNEFCISQWCTTAEDKKKMRKVVDALCWLCYSSEQTSMIRQFLDIIMKWDLRDVHQTPIFIRTFEMYVSGIYVMIKEQIRNLTYIQTRERLKRQMERAEGFVRGKDCQVMAKAWDAVLARVAREEKRDELEIPGIREFLLRNLLCKCGESENYHQNFVDQILGLNHGANRHLTTYETKNGKCNERDVLEYFQITENHVVFQYVQNLPPLFFESRPGVGDSEQGKEVAGNHNAAVYDGTNAVMGHDADGSDGSVIIGDSDWEDRMIEDMVTRWESDAIQFYEVKLERMFDDVLGILLDVESDINFEVCN